MSKKEKRVISENYHKYHIPGMPHHNTLKRNAIFINRHNSIKHEISKCLGALILSRYSEVVFTDKIKEAINLIEEEVKKLNLIENHTEFITEACPNSEPDRRVDLVNLKETETKLARYEFETDKTTKKSNSTTIYL